MTSVLIHTPTPPLHSNTLMNPNNNDEEEEEEDEMEDSSTTTTVIQIGSPTFNISSLVTQVQQHPPQHHTRKPTSTPKLTPTDEEQSVTTTSATATPYDDDHISSTNVYDDNEVAVDKQQPATTTTITTTTSSTTIKRSHTRKKLFSLFKPVLWCFAGSKSIEATPKKDVSQQEKHNSTKQRQSTNKTTTTSSTQLPSQQDVDVVDVETYEVTTTTTTVTTTIPTTTGSSTLSAQQQQQQQQQRKKKKKKKTSSRHYHHHSDSYGNRSGFGVGIRGKAPKALLGLQTPQLMGRKTLVLDLDETLVHSKFEPVAGADFEIPIDIEGRQHIVYVMKRPGVDEFLEEMGKLFEVVIFTASLSKYANPLLDKLDKKGVITGRLFREHCTYVDQCYIKDMSRLGRDIDSALIIDNSPACYAFQPRNAMPCTSWFDDQSDTELLQMIPWLQKLSQEKTVYETLDQWRQYFGANCQWY